MHTNARSLNCKISGIEVLIALRFNYVIHCVGGFSTIANPPTWCITYMETTVGKCQIPLNELSGFHYQLLNQPSLTVHWLHLLAIWLISAQFTSTS